MSEKPSSILNFSFYSKQEDETYKLSLKLRRISVFGSNEIQMIGNRLTNGLGTVVMFHAEMVRHMAVICHMVEEVIDGGGWYDNDDLIKTWSQIFDMRVLRELHKEVISYDEWFRNRHNGEPVEKQDKEASEEKHNKPIDTTSGVGRKKSKPKQVESGVSTVVVG